MAGALDLFSPAAREWFSGVFAAPTEVQERGWRAVASGSHTLMTAPTGSGKTLAAFMWCLDRLVTEASPPRGERCRVLYISPLKALAVDVERNLRAPLVGMRLHSRRLSLPVPDIAVTIRSGDTPADERRSMERTPPDILITTPESLYLLLTSAARRVLASVRWVIVDEIHSVAATKRGAHLAISLERLCALMQHEPQRIGLSATQRPLQEVGRFLGGVGREVAIVDAGARKTLEVRVEVPVEDMANLDRGVPAPRVSRGGGLEGGVPPLDRGVPAPRVSRGGGLEGGVPPMDRGVPAPRVSRGGGLEGGVPPMDRGVPAPRPDVGVSLPEWAGELPLPRRSIWPAIYPRLLELIQEHRSTIVFVN